jgi:plastocyanin
VRSLKPGTYTFVIQDRSTIHNYHLKGPGVDKKTAVPFLGTKTWTNVRLMKGKYTFVCDPHKANMHGSFTVK